MSQDAGTDEAYAKALAVHRNYETNLLSYPNVVGVGVGLRQVNGLQTDKVALVVMVNKKIPVEELKQKDVLPSEIEGVPVDVQEVGSLKAF
jgi:hypothetical protein